MSMSDYTGAIAEFLDALVEASRESDDEEMNVVEYTAWQATSAINDLKEMLQPLREAAVEVRDELATLAEFVRGGAASSKLTADELENMALRLTQALGE